MMRLSFGKSIFFAASALVLSCAAVWIFGIYRSAEKTLADERARLLDKNRVTFEKKNLTPHFSQNAQIWQNAAETRDFVRFQNSYFAATGGGLVQFDGDGKIVRHFTVLDGLPESDLTALAVFRGKLMIGTRTKNLVSFDGKNFENYIWNERKADAVTAFLEADGRLLIGTFSGGLLEFDGASFTEIKADNRQISRVNCLYLTDGKLFVGTFDNGLWIRQNDFWKHLTAAEGLPSNRIVGIVSNGEKLIAASDFGAAILENERFRPLGAMPALSGIAAANGQTYLTKDDGEILTLKTNFREFSAENTLQKTRLTTIGERLFRLSNQGIAEITGAKIKPFGEMEKGALTDNFVSALAFDKNQNLWVGTFRKGIDVFALGGKKLRHLETDNIREINYLHADGTTVSAATGNGLINFTGDFSAADSTGSDGLPSVSMTHLNGDWLATAKGLAFRENGKIRVLSTVQGLPNNAVYTTLQTGAKLYAGTLGGLAEIQNRQVVRTFRDSNSNLKTNWITALAETRERIFIGTYGGGVFELLPSGEIRSFETETGKFVVNPNAFYADGERLFVGTLDGVKILDLQTQKWSSEREFLPSAAVLSITGNDQKIYFGTTCGIAEISGSFFK